MLTPHQSSILKVIREHVTEYGFAPTLVELCDYTGTTSVGSMHKHLMALVRKGVIERGEGGWRNIILKNQCPCCGQTMVSRQ